MSTLDQIRHGLERAFDSLAEGWRQLHEHASDALTRFLPLPTRGSLETVGEQLARHAPRWALLAAELEETPEEVIVQLEAPGMEPDQFDISVVDDYLVVRGEKHVHREQHEGRYHLIERAYGRFERAIPLPTAVDQDRTRASYRRGVLTITLPRVHSQVRRRIQVQVD